MSQLEVLANGKPRSGKGTFLRTSEQIALDHRAAELRTQSKTFKEIGEILGVPLNTAYNMVQRAIEDIPREKTQELIALEVAKIDFLERKAIEILEKRHVFVSQGGKVVYDGDEKLEDDGPTLQAINTLAKLGERRARLLGLNAPTRTELTSTVAVSIEDRSQQAKGAVLSLLARLSNEQNLTVEGQNPEILDINTHSDE